MAEIRIKARTECFSSACVVRQAFLLPLTCSCQGWSHVPPLEKDPKCRRTRKQKTVCQHTFRVWYTRRNLCASCRFLSSIILTLVTSVAAVLHLILLREKLQREHAPRQSQSILCHQETIKKTHRQSLTIYIYRCKIENQPLSEQHRVRRPWT